MLLSGHQFLTDGVQRRRRRPGGRVRRDRRFPDRVELAPRLGHGRRRLRVVVRVALDGGGLLGEQLAEPVELLDEDRGRHLPGLLLERERLERGLAPGLQFVELCHRGRGRGLRVGQLLLGRVEERPGLLGFVRRGGGRGLELRRFRRQLLRVEGRRQLVPE
ncbi:hypothetical protein [Frigoriglobus tundricola]|uniref:hypothetical protein n=1 Tax=Frigoriglobus tundricola TaxID=2774151 RepID=UPI00148EC021|nr:hypothetical protein [Frigoriglobus tundricola]